AGRSIADDGAEHVVTVGEDRRRHDDLVADGPLHREATAVDLRLDALDLNARRWFVAWRRHRGETFARDGAQTLERDLSPSDLASRWKARRRGIPLRRLARGGGTVVVAGPAARSSRRRRLALRVVLGLRRIAGAARGAARTRGRVGCWGFRGAAYVLEWRLG